MLKISPCPSFPPLSPLHASHPYTYPAAIFLNPLPQLGNDEEVEVLVDMVTARGAWPRSLPIVVGFLRRFGPRFTTGEWLGPVLGPVYW